MKIFIIRYGFTFIVMFGGIFLFFGCKTKVEQKELIGVYAAKYPYGMEQLRITPNGTYEQLFAFKGQSLKTVNKGKWEIRYLDGQQLILNNPIIIDDGFGNISTMKKESDSAWPLHIYKSITGKIFFPINEDLGFVFKKIQ